MSDSEDLSDQSNGVEFETLVVVFRDTEETQEEKETAAELTIATWDKCFFEIHMNEQEVQSVELCFPSRKRFGCLFETDKINPWLRSSERLRLTAASEGEDYKVSVDGIVQTIASAFEGQKGKDTISSHQITPTLQAQVYTESDDMKYRPLLRQSGWPATLIAEPGPKDPREATETEQSAHVSAAGHVFSRFLDNSLSVYSKGETTLSESGKRIPKKIDLEKSFRTSHALLPMYSQVHRHRWTLSFDGDKSGLSQANLEALDATLRSLEPNLRFTLHLDFVPLPDLEQSAVPGAEDSNEASMSRMQ